MSGESGVGIICATVSPKNPVSSSSLLRSGYTRNRTLLMYSGIERDLYYKIILPNHTELPKSEIVPRWNRHFDLRKTQICVFSNFRSVETEAQSNTGHQENLSNTFLLNRGLRKRYLSS